ncbi:MAG: hypothetical protein IT460_15260 [Planctomycetes bacterium]|nr:hypothetical protein [Planctomycetota bacterium]
MANRKIRATRDGKTMFVESGGAIDFKAGAALKFGGVAVRFAGGEAALDGANPTPVDTGLTTVLGFVATLKGSVAPGDNTSVLTAVIDTDGVVNVHAWKNTGGTDPTLVASTGTESFYWVAFGT